ncbi:MAG: HAD family hydrolase [Reyranella sp.]|uniref:HAD family hydrolase n=1 Tax=Reyranella sp. TaxID=1929291 RepID=UPI001AC465C4|nr:HAD family hydrolase [Reyranella sp.]MBN9089505.1 HAD family hydrolase [Reyranella sp.]
MTAFGPSDWHGLRLVVFDVDGTLYRQRPLRLRMARDLLLHALLRRDLATLLVLRKYRRLREQMGDERVEDFAGPLVARTAAAIGCPPERVRAIVSQWIDRHPLPYLRACRYDGLGELFAGLRRHGKTIGVLSDYPAAAKLAALELTADHVITADDPGIGILKPHPRGLETLIRQAGTTPATTLLIGDRAERDGLAARAAGARVLLRASRPIDDWQTIARYDEALFAPMLA